LRIAPYGSANFFREDGICYTVGNVLYLAGAVAFSYKTFRSALQIPARFVNG
jgi:hypothetical protein